VSSVVSIVATPVLRWMTGNQTPPQGDAPCVTGSEGHVRLLVVVVVVVEAEAFL